jgi:hypothetical protein
MDHKSPLTRRFVVHFCSALDSLPPFHDATNIGEEEIAPLSLAYRAYPVAWFEKNQPRADCAPIRGHTEENGLLGS